MISGWLGKIRDERYKRALLTTGMNVGAQGIQLLTGLISVPLTLTYVGTERFGMWMTISTALSFITFSDFGVGIGLQSKMSTALALNDLPNARRSFLTTMLFVTALCIVIIATGYIVASRANLTQLFSLQSRQAIEEVGPTVQMVMIVFGLGLLSGIIQRAFNALQEGFVIAIIQIGARIASLALLFVAVKNKMGLPILTLVVNGLPVLAILICGAVVLGKRHPWIRPTIHAMREWCDTANFKGILNIGLMGLGATIAVYFVNNLTPLILSTKYGADEVADYVIILRLIAVPTILLTYVLIPLWPAIAEAQEKHEFDWIRSAYTKYRLVTLAIAFVSAITLLLWGQPIIRLWTRNDSVVPSMPLLVASVAFMLIGYWNALLSVMLNGLSKFKGQASYGLVLAVAFIGFAYALPNTFGKEIVIWVVLLGYAIRCIIMQVELSTYLKRYLISNTSKAELALSVNSD